VPALVAAAAIGAIAAESIHMAMEMQTADAAIAVAGGTSVKAATAIGNAFLGTAGKTEFSGKEMAESYATVAGQLRSTEGHALDASSALSVMNATSDLATAKQISLGTATSSVVGIMQAFSLKTKDAAGVADILFNASVATGQGVDTLSAGLEKMKSKLGDAAPPLGQLAGLMVDLTNHGETGRAALTAVSAATQTLITAGSGVAVAQQAQASAFAQLSPKLQALATEYKEGKITSEAFATAGHGLSTSQALQFKAFSAATDAIETAKEKLDAMGITVDNAQGKFVGMSSIIGQLHNKIQGETQAQQLATLTTAFGAASASKMLSVVEAGPAVYDAATKAVTKTGSAHAAAAIQAQTLGVEFKTLEATAEDLMTRLGQFLIPILEVLVKGFVALVNIVVDVVRDTVGLVEKLMPLKDALEAIGVVVGVVVVAALYSYIAAQISALAVSLATMGGLSGLAAAFGSVAVTEAAAAAPVLLIIAALVALGVAAYEIYKHWKTIWDGIKDATEAVWNFLENDVIHPLVSVLEGPLLDSLHALEGAWNAVWNGIKGTAVTVFNFLWNDVFSPIIHIYEDVILGALHVYEDAWKDVWHGVQSVVEEVWDILKSIFGDIMKGINDITGGISKVEHVAGAIGHGAAGAVHDVLGWLGTGGVVHTKGIYGLAESGPEAVIPLSQLGGKGGIASLPSVGGASGGMGGSALTHSGDVNFYIAGAPQMTQTQLMTEMSFAVKTGAFQITPAKAS
jgi:phage-related minor tail protein